MRPRDRSRGQRITQGLRAFSSMATTLQGIGRPEALECLVEQIVESIRRIEYVHWVRDGHHDAARMDPHGDLFDPLKAAVLHHRRGRTDEAFWLVFVAVHFGKHAQDGWLLTKNIYGRLGGPGLWDWTSISAGTKSFKHWRQANEGRLLRGPSPGRFSNHRKYESLRADSDKSTAVVFSSYVQWIEQYGSHAALIRRAHQEVGQHPQEVFDHLYRSMKAVMRFGRLGKFDFLTMLGKLGMAPIEPGSAYLKEATGPLRGARLLIDGTPTSQTLPSDLEKVLARLDSELNLGMQVWEDSLCNWQKSPTQFISFKG